MDVTGASANTSPAGTVKAEALFGTAPKPTDKRADDVPMDGQTPLAHSNDKIGGTIPPQPAPVAAEPQPMPKPNTPQQDLAQIVTGAGVIFDDFRSFVSIKRIASGADSWASFDDVPTLVCSALQSAPKLMAELIRKFGKK